MSTNFLSKSIQFLQKNFIRSAQQKNPFTILLSLLYFLSDSIKILADFKDYF